jgi:hypothetical protein
MPFPLAHPAAVLPLRRYCPRFFSFPALFIGSLSPDFGYCFGGLDVDEFSHRLVGSIGFCLPAGLLVLMVFRHLQWRAVDLFPERVKPALRRLCQHPAGSPLVIVASVLIGAWSHLFLDSLTHREGCLVERLPLLRAPVVSAFHHTALVYHVLWYALTFAGVVWLWLAGQAWLRTTLGSSRLVPAWMKWCDAALFGTLAVLLSSVAHLHAHSLALYGALAIGVLSAVAFMRRKSYLS